MKKNVRSLVLASIFAALIVVMTVTPYFGYITYGPVEITTLHIVVILGAVFLGWKYGAVLGGIWGVTCVLRAFTNPIWAPFINPLISVLPRILVGLFAGLVFSGLRKKNVHSVVAAGAAAIVGTLTNTVLVLSTLYLFGGMIKIYTDFFELFKTIWLTIIGINGVIELIAAIVLVPVLYKALETVNRPAREGV
ncbi:MAG TPA: ECF transporter S component [Candidatus Avimonoglobus intestinipullorum]|uniref:ECF transporter S component n=1 Tax=Candidatus Avimonoglobus intestinipullorum TaxID=2840699 RepID=A0A9D1LU22_9FIRM|nr:ECF transporter S component [Candidatus Avimonoglobus intestinipullorum]